jgi:PAS domain S-box-containing protein
VAQAIVESRLLKRTALARRDVLKVLLLAAAYFAAGKLGLSLAEINESVSAVWPPTGIALAALLLWGYRLWPGVFLGAFLVNITTQGNWATTLGIAAGNTLEPLAGAWLVNRFANGTRAFQRVEDIFKFIALAAILSTLVSATFGMTSLSLGGYSPWREYGEAWFTWWLGDMVGALLVAPAIILWASQPLRKPRAGELLEQAAMLLAVIAIGQVVFMDGFLLEGSTYAFMTIPPLLWAAFRFSLRNVVLLALVMSGLALWGTLNENGPFLRDDANVSLLLLQSYIGTIALTVLLTGAGISQRKRAEEEAVQTGDRLNMVLNSVTNGLIVLDREYRITHLSRAAQAILRGRGRDPDAALGQVFWDAFPHLRRTIARTKYEECIEKRVPVTYEAKRDDGRWFNVLAYPNADGGLTTISIDITDLKRAEETSRADEERLQLALAAGHMGAWEWNIVSGKVTWSTTLEKIHGLAPGSFGRGFEDFKRDIHPEDAGYVFSQIQETLENKGQYHVQYRIIRPDGEVRWLEAFDRVNVGEDGRAVKLIGVCADITARSRAEEEVRSSRDLLNVVVNSVTAAFTLMDKEFRILYLSKGAQDRLRSLGGDPASAIGKVFWDEYSHLRGTMFEEKLRESMERQEPVSFQVEREDGRWLHMTAHPTSEGGLATLATDITEVKRVEEALRQAQQQEQVRRMELEALMETAPAIVWIAHNPECRMITGNRAGQDFLRVPKGGNLSKTAPKEEQPEHFEVYEDGRLLSRDELPMQKVGRTGKPIYGVELEDRFSDGTAKWTYGNVVPLLHQDGSVRGVLATFVEITDLKRAEERLRRSLRDKEVLLRGSPPREE